jgi:cob(I)alamin adenosyltransferase
VEVQKTDSRIEAYGTVDELLCYLGMLRDLLDDSEIRAWLLSVQEKLMVTTALLACDKSVEVKLPLLQEQDVAWLETTIDKMEEMLEPVHNFIIPGGNVTVSQAHICRSVCRRAERRIVAAYLEHSMEDDVLLKYFNRLSDFFYVLSRYIAKKLDVKEIPWMPQK